MDLNKVTIFCFAASYSAALALELSRLVFRAPIRLFVIVGFTLGGLLAHSIYLYVAARDPAPLGTPLSSWSAWCLMAAWIMAAAYLVLCVRRPENALGIFLLPLVLSLIGLAAAVRSAPPFARAEALNRWGIVHGVSLLLGTVAVLLGFAAGVMYLVQSYRLKRKLPPRQGLRLPSLEWLQRLNRESLLVSTVLLAGGLISGIVLNMIKHSQDEGGVPWTDPVVLSSAVLFAWLVASSLFEFLYKPARQGRKVAYLTLASFVFLGLALGAVLLGEHARGTPENRRTPNPPNAASQAETLDSVGDRTTGRRPLATRRPPGLALPPRGGSRA